MRTLAVFIALACLTVIASIASAYAVSFNCVPYFRTGVPSPQIISNVTQIPNATQEQWWIVDCKAIPVTISTDKLSYQSGDTIAASGTAANTPAGMVLAIKVVAPNGNIVRVDQTAIGSDGTFAIKIITGGALWQQAGMYTISAQEINTQKSSNAQFYFSGPPAVPYGSSILVQNTNMTVPYTIINGKVNSITVNTYMRSLTISLQTTGNGALTIDLPRSLIDSKGANQTDLDFVVTSDGKAPLFEETRNATSRNLVIPFENNMTQIRIIGTQIIPEFGSASMLILAAITAFAVIISATKFKGLNCHNSL